MKSEILDVGGVFNNLAHTAEFSLVSMFSGGAGGWSEREAPRGGGGPPLPTNDRWKEPEPGSFGNGGGYGGGGRDNGPPRGGGGGGGGQRRNEASDWTKPQPRNEKLELELFGTGHGPSGINFDRYEDIPVEATGRDVPKGTVNLNLFKLNLFLF